MHFRDLSEAQILALAITAGEEHIYRDSAELSARMALTVHVSRFTNRPVPRDSGSPVPRNSRTPITRVTTVNHEKILLVDCKRWKQPKPQGLARSAD